MQRHLDLAPNQQQLFHMTRTSHSKPKLYTVWTKLNKAKNWHKTMPPSMFFTIWLYPIRARAYCRSCWELGRQKSVIHKNNRTTFTTTKPGTPKNYNNLRLMNSHYKTTAHLLVCTWLNETHLRQTYKSYQLKLTPALNSCNTSEKTL